MSSFSSEVVISRSFNREMVISRRRRYIFFCCNREMVISCKVEERIGGEFSCQLLGKVFQQQQRLCRLYLGEVIDFLVGCDFVSIFSLDLWGRVLFCGDYGAVRKDELCGML